MDYGFNKTSSNYDASKPLGGIATGDTGTRPSATPSSPLNFTGQQQLGSANNGTSLTDSYNRSLELQQGATRAAQSLSGYTPPDPNQPQSALPGFDFSKLNPEQQKAFTSFIGGLFGFNNQNETEQPNGLAQVGTPSTTPSTTQPTQPALRDNDPTRQQNDPFAITSASRNLF